MDKNKRIKIGEYGLFFDTANNSLDPWTIDICRTVLETKLGYCYQTEHQGIRYFDHARKLSIEEGERFFSIHKNYLIGFKISLVKLLNLIRHKKNLKNEDILTCVIKGI